MYKKITFLLGFITLEQNNLNANHLEKIFEDIIHCRHLIQRAYNGVDNLPPAIADKYQELKHFCRFESVINIATFISARNIRQEDLSLKLGHVYRGVNEERTVIVFRGSQYKDEWLGDLGNVNCSAAAASTLHELLPGMIHEGFLRAVGQFYPSIEACIDIDAISRPNHEILVTGHSRGAAFALLVAVRLQSWLQAQHIDTKNRIKIITFSAPEMVIGDSEFWQHIDSKIGGINVIKICNDLDMVPVINVGNLASYTSPKNVFAITIPIWDQEIAPTYATRILTRILSISQQPGFDLMALGVGVLQETLIFPHGIQADSILKRGYKENLSKYVQRWIQEVYLPQKLPLILDHSELLAAEVPQLHAAEILPLCINQCIKYLSNCQRSHSGEQLVSEEVTYFLRESEQILQDGISRAEKRMRVVHFIIRCGIVDPITVSSLLQRVEMDWRRSIGLVPQG